MVEKFLEFKKSKDSLRVYEEHKLVYISKSRSLSPLLKLLASADLPANTIVFDKIIGLAAAKLIFLLKPVAVFTPLGTYAAEGFLHKNGIATFFLKKVEKILGFDKKTDCRHEKIAKNIRPELLVKILRKP